MSSIGIVIKSLYKKEIETFQKVRSKRLNRIKLISVKLKRYLYEHPTLAKVLRISLSIIGIVIVSSLIHFYNDFGRLSTRVEAAHANIGKEIRRRDNLIPNLVLAAENYVFHEQKVFKHVSDAREIFFNIKNATMKPGKSSELSSALSKLLALVEQYPNLKATESIQDLVKELTNTENRIAEEKSKYNENTRHFNQLLSVFPTNVLGKIYGYGKQYPYIATDEDFLKVPYVANFNKEKIQK